MAFVERTGTDNPFNQINVGGISKPTFADIDGDGDKDLIVGAEQGGFTYYRNDGNGQYSQLTGVDANPIHSIYSTGIFSAIAVADLDNDGDLDAVVGSSNGKLDYFRNNGTVNGVMQWQRTETTSPFKDYNLTKPQDVEYSAPAFADLDNDGDLDAVVGSDTQGILFLRNDGGTFNRVDGNASPFAQFNLDNTTPSGPLNPLRTPTFGDFDGDGDLDAAIGSATGQIAYLQNNGGTFTEQTGTSNPFRDWNDLTNQNADQDFSAPSFVDVDGDGDMDAVIGVVDGRLRYLENTTGGSQPPATIVESAGNTDLLKATTGYQLQPDGGNAIALLLNGQAVTDALIPGWQAIGAEAKAGGYEVIFRHADGSYAQWTVDANGSVVSTAPLTLSELLLREPDYQQDLNGDQQIGPPSTPNQAPSQLVFSLNKQTYAPDETLASIGYVVDADGFGDINRVDFRLIDAQGGEIDISDAVNFGPATGEPNKAAFTYQYNLAGLAAGTYTLRGAAWDSAGNSSPLTDRVFTIADTSTPPNNPPSLSINNISVAEGNDGSKTVTFTVTLSNASTQTVTVDYATANGTGTAGIDYLATSGTLSFAPNTTTQTIMVTVNGDTTIELDETFFLNLSNAVNATIANNQGIGTIQNDDVLTNPPPATPDLSVSTDIFTVGGSGDLTKLLLSLVQTSSSAVNEVGLFKVDDGQGSINGIASGSNGYLEAALSRSEVVFSTLANRPNGLGSELQRILEFAPGDRLRFYLVRNGTTDSVLSGQISSDRVVLSNTTSIQITNPGNNTFSLKWEDGTGAVDFQDLILQVQPTNQTPPIGTGMQGNSQAELFDLRNFQGRQLRAEFSIHREAAFNNFVGFYQVNNAQGTVTDPLTGATIAPGQAGYTQAALRARVSGVDLTVANQATATITDQFAGGSILAPFIIVNGRPDALLDSNPSNDPAIYFPFLGANSDGVDHIRLLADNTFGFEDLPGGGDADYNDIIVRANLTVV